MLGRILKLGAFIVIALLGYNYFFGNEEEKAQSREIVGKAADLGRDAWGLLRSERQKLSEGKYDDALDKLNSLYGELRQTATRLRDSDVLERLGELEKTRQQLEEELATASEEARPATERKVEELTEATEELMKKIEQEAQ